MIQTYEENDTSLGESKLKAFGERIEHLKEFMWPKVTVYDESNEPRLCCVRSCHLSESGFRLEELTVEELAMQHYLGNGFQCGIHCEGAVLRDLPGDPRNFAGGDFSQS